MKLKHMKINFNRLPDRAATLYYAVGEEDAVMYESVVLVLDSQIILMDAFQLDTFVTFELTKNIRELTAQEFMDRQTELRKAMLS